MTGETLYTLFIWPVRLILEFLFVLFNRIFDAPGPAVIFLSVVVNTLSLPVYLIADRWQKEERNLQKRMKKKIADIRAVFKGDERQMILNTYNRQMGYSPVFVLKASIGLLLQIPFFIAAYQFLSRTAMLSGVSFLFLRNLSVPDGLLRITLPRAGIIVINVMPILMTSVNLASSLIYARDMEKRERIQLVAMALVFLVLLYNSPSGLVLYWTMNNVYSLVKNAAQAGLKKPGRALHLAVSFSAGVFLFLIWSGRASVERYRVLFTGIALVLMAVPFIWRGLLRLLDGRPAKVTGNEPVRLTAKSGDMTALYVSSLAVLFLLIGFLNPAQVLSASAADFEKPLEFVLRTALQGFAFLVMIPLFVRALASFGVRRVLAAGAAALTISCLISYFALSASYGVMDRNFRLDDTGRLLHAFPLWISIAVPAASILLAAAFIVLGKDRLLAALFQAGAAALLVLGAVNMVSLVRQSAALSRLQARTSAGIPDPASGFPAVFPLSAAERNVFIVFFDRAQGTAMTDALAYMPDLREQLDGFAFYPNTLSFGSCTVTGVPAMLGGYEYTPAAINKRKDELLVDKVNEALTALPRLFGKAGYRVSITDPVIANMQSVPDVSIFQDLPNVTAGVLSGKLSDRFRAEFPNAEEKAIDTFDFDILFRYGLFRSSPPALRYGIHYKGQWWKEAAYNSYGRAVAEFSALYYLPDLCPVDSNTGTLNIFMNAVTHESGAYDARLFPKPEAVLFDEPETAFYGSESNAEYMYTFMSAMKQFVKWLSYLKQHGVYDNTRIIVVSDHGGNYHGGGIEFSEMEGHNPILLVKDFDSRGAVKISQELMTHADTPSLAAAGLLGPGPEDGGIPAAAAKEESGTESVKSGGERAETGGKEPEGLAERNRPLVAVGEVSSQPLRHGPYQFNLEGRRELKGRELFRKESWGEWERD
ncbi:MAG: YidC/Oxa1 family membrane protein insertase [Treponema sp.]|jgi:YidC/Oxa1 family membrane protein insertase|nr:YidC/Oxa1 family membrane protein insertase [Treponema sp.]